ncbi:sigma-70 family RNA polymerase sigma factor [Streptomyces sp. P38-E01]|uniref:Sigma-70 family RNA polymerase sigma factor n=1 Tax=Streptomyces tardus TaxID=2780544 RepID=A0A949JFY9_9ACTN|nr:sigma-70 family RNA polymerase sigma factor [Streptomyces tardus]MBU7598228.1 sigma-70 family RNA polymerase sigma factor [Streptomyces tardus]
MRRAVEAVYRIESPRIIAGIARIVRDVGIAEELAQDALVAALERWPESGVPDRPGAWLMATARHRAVDLLRRRETYARKLAEVGRALEEVPSPEDRLPDAADDIDDDLLRLIFTACHPVLRTEGRIALTLRLLGGLTTEEIARAFLTSAPTVAQRVTRAKRTLAAAGVPFEVPHDADRVERLASVLEVVYLVFNEGYSATAGDDLLRPGLCEDALRLVRVLAELMPEEPEVHGLAALLEFQAARMPGRVGPDGEVVLLADQDRTRWNRLLIGRGVAALERAGRGPYALQAAIAACHAYAVRYEDTDWRAIAALYRELAALTGSPVVELNRAVAVSMADGPAAGLRLLEKLADEPALRGYHLLPSVRGDLLERLGRFAASRAEFARAAELAGNERERDLLRSRADHCAALAADEAGGAAGGSPDRGAVDGAEAGEVKADVDGGGGDGVSGSDEGEGPG